MIRLRHLGIIAVALALGLAVTTSACSTPKAPTASTSGAADPASPATGCDDLPLARASDETASGPVAVVVIHPTTTRADLQPAIDAVVADAVDRSARLSVIVASSTTTESVQTCFAGTAIVGRGNNAETKRRAAAVLKDRMPATVLAEADRATAQIEKASGDPSLDDPVADVAVGVTEARRVAGTDKATLTVLSPGVPLAGCGRLEAKPGTVLELNAKVIEQIRTACEPRLPDVAGLTIRWAGYGRGSNHLTSSASSALRDLLTQMLTDAGATSVSISDAVVPDLKTTHGGDS